MANILDLIVVGILALCIWIAYRKGFVITVFRFFSLLIALFLTNMLYPAVSVAMRNIGLLDTLKSSVAATVRLDGAVEGITRTAEVELINGLALPEFIKTALLENNNTQAYTALAVDSFQDYISGFLAGMILNAIAMIAVFVVVFVLMKIIAAALNILTKLPVIHSLNKLLGIAVGLLQGTVFVWLVLAVMVGLFAANQTFPVGELLPQTVLAWWFHENNMILKLVMQVFG